MSTVQMTGPSFFLPRDFAELRALKSFTMQYAETKGEEVQKQLKKLIAADDVAARIAATKEYPEVGEEREALIKFVIEMK